MRHTDVYTRAALCGQPFLDDRYILDLRRQHDLLRQKRCAGIKLLHKGREYLTLTVLRRDTHIKMFPPDQLSAADKEDLYHRVTLVIGKRYDVLVLSVKARDLLFLRDLLYAV